MSKNEDLERLRRNLKNAIGRNPTDEEFVLYLMHPKDTIEFIEWREKFGEAPLVLPTHV